MAESELANAVPPGPSVTVLPGTPSAVVREPLAGAYFWVLAFFVLYCARPEDWIPGLHYLPLAKIVGVFALLAFVMSLGRIKKGFPRITILLVMLVVWLALASTFSPVWRGGAFRTTLGFAKVVLIVVVMSVAVTSLARLRKLIFIQAACVGVVAVASIVKGHFVVGRLEGALNGFYHNPNDLAIAIVLSLPFCIVFLLNGRGPLRKVAWIGILLAMIYALLRTGSRAGLIALIVALVLCLWEFGVKGRRSYLVLASLVLFAGLFVIAGHRVMQRFSNTSQYEGNGAAYQSAQLRKGLLVKSLKITLEHPLFGIGPGDFQVISGSWEETHDVYTEFSAEAGIPALILFLMIYWRALAELGEVKRQSTEQSEVSMLAGACRAGLIAFAIAALFYPDAYQFFLFFVLSFAAALHGISQKGAGAPAQPAGDAEKLRVNIRTEPARLPAKAAPVPVNLR